MSIKGMSRDRGMLGSVVFFLGFGDEYWGVGSFVAFGFERACGYYCYFFYWFYWYRRV